MLTFVLWKWEGHSGPPYRAEHVNTMVSMLKREVQLPHRSICITDDPTGVQCQTYPLWDDYANLRQVLSPHLPSCYRRLRLFDTGTTRLLGIPDGSMVAQLDLDMVFVNDATEFFSRTEDFCAWRREIKGRPVSYCPAVLMFRAGTMDHLWRAFSPGRLNTIWRSRYQGSDQGWISYVLRGQYPGWREQEDGIYSFSIKDKWLEAGELPANAIVVAFNGRKGKPWDPEVMAAYPWVQRNWH